jgi:hypothetical protein
MRFKYLIPVFAFFMLTGCSRVKIIKNQHYKPVKIEKIILLELKCTKIMAPRCSRLKEQLEDEFLKNGFDVLDRKHTETFMKEQAMGASGLTEEDYVKLGKMLQAQAVILGVFFRKYTALKIISTETGQVIMKVKSRAKIGKTVKVIARELNN